jgi:hypothetical protein
VEPVVSSAAPWIAAGQHAEAFIVKVLSGRVTSPLSSHGHTSSTSRLSALQLDRAYVTGLLEEARL